MPTIEKQLVREKQLVSIPEGAAFLDVSSETLRRWIYERRIESLKIGRCRKIRLTELRRFMKDSTIARVK